MNQGRAKVQEEEGKEEDKVESKRWQEKDGGISPLKGFLHQRIFKSIFPSFFFRLSTPHLPFHFPSRFSFFFRAKIFKPFTFPSSFPSKSLGLPFWANTLFFQTGRYFFLLCNSVFFPIPPAFSFFNNSFLLLHFLRNDSLLLFS